MPEQNSKPRFRVAIVPVTGFQQNCSLFYDEASKLAAVIDPGGDVPVILDAINKLGLKIEKILLTHGHIDHAGGAAELKDALRVPIEGPHRGDASLLESLPKSGASYGMTGARVVTPDRWLIDGDSVEVAGYTFEVITAPGHSPGSVVYFYRAGRFAFMGDVLFKGSIGRTDFAGGDHATLLKSIREKMLPLGDDVMFLPGHGPASRIGDERLNNPFLNS